MTKVGGLTSKYYKETKGMKVSGGQRVKKGTMLTREGHRWQPGINILGKMHLVAGIDGEVYFTKKRGARRVITFINIKALEETTVKAKSITAKSKKSEEK
jgi:ribosomal protein L27